MTKTLRFAGWRVVLDSSEVFANDPGAGTPAMVYAPSGASGTFWCVWDTGELDCGAEDVPPDVCHWLDRIAGAVTDFVAEHSHHVCSCCGEITRNGRDCCSDDFPDASEVRENGR